MTGGWSDCNKDKRSGSSLITKKFNSLANLNVLRATIVYDENVVSCSSQVVAGFNYKFKLKFNDEICSISLFEKLDETFELRGIEDGVMNCLEFFGTEETIKKANSDFKNLVGKVLGW